MRERQRVGVPDDRKIAAVALREPMQATEALIKYPHTGTRGVQHGRRRLYGVVLFIHDIRSLCTPPWHLWPSIVLLSTASLILIQKL